MAPSNYELNTGSATYDAVDHDPSFFVRGAVVKLIAEGATGYPGVLPAGYATAALDDSAWPDAVVPVVGLATADDPGVPHTVVPNEGTGHWVVRAHIDFPDYAIPSTVSVFSGPTYPEKPYLFLMNIHNGVKVTVDDVEVVSGRASFSSSLLTQVFFVTPGPHVVVLECTGSPDDNMIDALFAVPRPLIVTPTLPTLGRGNMAIHVDHCCTTFDDHGIAFGFDDKDLKIVMSGSAAGSQTILADATRSKDATPADFVMAGPGDYTLVTDSLIWKDTRDIHIGVVTEFPMLAATRATASLRPLLHTPKPGAVPDGVFAPVAPAAPTAPPAPTPPNDLYANPTLIAGPAGMVVFSIAGAGFEFDADSNYEQLAAVYDGHTVWFKWTAPITGVATFDTAATPPPRWDSTLAAYNDGPTVPIDTSRQLAFSDDGELQPGVVTADGFGTSKITFPVVAGTAYRIQVDSWVYPAAGGNPDSGYPRDGCRLRWSVV